MVTLLILLGLIFGLLMGIRRGFILQVVHLTGFIISLIVATIYYKKLAEHLALWIPYPDIGNDSLWAVFLNTMPLETAFYNAIAFAIIFFAAKIILQVIATMLDFVANFPVLRKINKWLGALLGFIEMYVLIFIILFILALAPIESIQLKIEQSFLAKLIIEHTPILSSAVKSLWFTDNL